MNNENLSLWSKVEKTDPNHTKKANKGGNKITSICPQYQRKNATQQFGQFGKGWGVINETFHTTDFNDGTVLGSYKAVFWYDEDKKYQFPICSNVKVAFTTSTGKYKIDDEWMKKASTDALTKGLSMLGFNSDIFLGLFDDDKYVNNRIAEEIYDERLKAYQPINEALKELKKCNSIEELKKAFESLNNTVKNHADIKNLKNKMKEDFEKQ